MVEDLARTLVEGFIRNAWKSIETIVRNIAAFNTERRRNYTFFCFKGGQRTNVVSEGKHYFLRGSVEYANPQITVEEVQGVVVTRLLAVCGNYFHEYGLHPADAKDVDVICERVKKPIEGIIVPFLLNTDEVEPDRYSMNPLKASLVNSGQSAFPAMSVRTDNLKLDENFVRKYEGSLISKDEVELIGRHLKMCQSYLDLVDAVKYEQLEDLSKAFGMDLCLCITRLPLTLLETEATTDLLHHVIKELHTDYASIERVYACMGRSMKNRTTLLTIPHSKKGYASKRAARGKIYFDGTRLKSVKVTYQTTALYPNAIDPNDVSVAVGEDSFTVDGEKLGNYNYRETPSSPQFFLYSLASPENAVIWHGIGAFGASELLRSYTTMHAVCTTDSLVKDLRDKYGVITDIPAQFNLPPNVTWFHPVHRNIDASIGCIQNLNDLVKIGIGLEPLQSSAYIRKPAGSDA